MHEYIEFSSLQFRFFTKVPNPLKAHPRNGKLENSASAATCGSCKGLSTEPAPHLCKPVPNSFRPVPVVHIVCSDIQSMGDWHFDWHSAAQGSFCILLHSIESVGSMKTHVHVRLWLLPSGNLLCGWSTLQARVWKSPCMWTWANAKWIHTEWDRH